MLKESGFPTVEEIAAAISHLPSRVDDSYIDCEGDRPHIDVRLQVYDNGSWAIRSGDASFDHDHRGFWGAGSVGQDDTPEDLRPLAAALRDEAIEDCAMCDELEEEENNAN